MKRPYLIIILLFITKLVSAQTTETIRGRVLGQNLEELQGVKIINMCNADTAFTNKRGFYKILVAKGDSLFFLSEHYSQDKRAIKRIKDNVNIILIKRKANGIADHNSSDYKKAVKEDASLYEILDKGAERNGQWNY